MKARDAGSVVHQSCQYAYAAAQWPCASTSAVVVSASWTGSVSSMNSAPWMFTLWTPQPLRYLKYNQSVSRHNANLVLQVMT